MISGLTGFGTGLTALPIWLIAVEPLIAGPIVVICSAVAQLQTLPAIWRSIEWRLIVPFLITAIAGVPLGTVLLSHVDSTTFRFGIGLLLVLYSSTMLLSRIKAQKFFVAGNRVSNSLVGFFGGVLGGAAGLSGVIPTIWIGLHNWGKDKKRGFFQGFNLVVLVFSLLSMWIAGYLNNEIYKVALVAIPGTLIGAWLGRKAYNILDDTNFDIAVLLVFFLAGSAIIVFWFRA